MTFWPLHRAPGGGAKKCAVAHPIHVSNSHTKFGWNSSNGLGGDSVTDTRTDGRMDGVDCNIPDAVLKKRGDNNNKRQIWTPSEKNFLDPYMFQYEKWKLRLGNRSLEKSVLIFCTHVYTRDVVYVRTVADLMIKAKVNAYIMYIFGTIELSSLHATKNDFQMITLMTSKRQRHTYILDTGKMVEI